MRQLMNEYSPYLLQISFMYVKDWATAEDIVQECFIKFFQRPEAFKGHATLKTYLTKMVMHRATDYLRSWRAKKQAFSRFLKQPISPQQTVDEQLAQQIEQSELLKFVLALPLKYREVIMLYYYEELTTFEMAQLLTLSENTVKTRLRRGRALLKKELTAAQWEAIMYE